MQRGATASCCTLQHPHAGTLQLTMFDVAMVHAVMVFLTTSPSSHRYHNLQLLAHSHGVVPAGGMLLRVAGGPSEAVG
jgi:hypothetical protein